MIRGYPEELKQRAVQMVVDLHSETVSEWNAMGRVAELLGIGTAETVRKWVRLAGARCRRQLNTDQANSTDRRNTSIKEVCCGKAEGREVE